MSEDEMGQVGMGNKCYVRDMYQMMGLNLGWLGRAQSVEIQSFA